MTKFSPYLLKSIFALLLTDDEFHEQFFSSLKCEHFNYDDKYLYTLAKAYWAIYDKYGSVDEDTYVEEVFNNKGKSIDLYYTPPTEEDLQNLLDLFMDIVSNPVKNRQYVIDNTIQVLKVLSVHKIFIKNKKDLAAGTVDVDSFVEEIVEATSLVSSVSLGDNLFTDLNKRTEERLENPTVVGKVTVGIAGLDEYFEERSILPGSLAFWLAPSGAGKTNSLIYVAKEAALVDGLNVLFVSAELPSYVIKQRFDSAILGIPLWDIRKKADIVRNMYLTSPVFSALAKKIVITEVPMGSATVADIAVIIDKLARKDFKVDLLVIDYADHLTTKRKQDTRFEVTSIYKDMKALAVARNMVVFTASQMNSAGVEQAEKKRGVVSMLHVAEARAKVHLSDVVLAISRNQEDKDSQSARICIVKNRLGSGEGQVIRIFNDYTCARFYNGKSEECVSRDEELEEFFDSKSSKDF